MELNISQRQKVNKLKTNEVVKKQVCVGESAGATGEGDVSVLYILIGKALSEKTLEQRPEGTDGTSDEDFWRKSVPGRRQSRCKVLEMGASLVCLKSNGAAVWPWLSGQRQKEMT